MALSEIKKQKIKKLFGEFILIFPIVALVLLMTIISPYFMTVRNIVNILQQVAVLQIVSVGMAFVMIAGGIDLSVGSLISFIAAIAASLIAAEMPIALVVILAMVIAVGCGFINGFIISRVKAEPFIITLGMMSIYQGLALLITKGTNIGLSGQFTWLGRGRVIGIPAPVLIFVIVSVIFHFILKYTKLGRKVYSIGGNETAAFLSGIRIRNYKIIIYMITSGVVGLASLVLLSRVSSASPIMGNGFELQSIAACVIGGVTLKGGKGTVIGTFLGVLLLGLISNSLNLLDVPSFYQNITLGAIIVGAVIFTDLGERKNVRG